MTISRRWKIAGAVIALVALLVVVTLVAYARVQAGKSANANSHIVGFGNVRTSGSPYGYGYPYGYAPGYPYGYAPSYPYGYAPGSPYGYSSPVPGYPYNYGNPYGGPQIGYGYGPPRAMSVSQLPGQVGCGQPPYGYTVYGPCGMGAYTGCLYYLSSPACNQQLANGTRCGYGYASCITLQLSCRLPAAGGGPGSGGFITFPQGDFTLDPGSNVTAPDGQNYGLTYDEPLSRWLPVSYSWVSPDGKHYAYGDRSGVVHSVDLSSGADTVLTTSGSWQPIGYLSEGVYIVHRDGTLGLWLAAPGSVPKLVTPNGSWQVVANGAGYGSPSAQYPTGATNDIIRVNLATGAVSQWFRRAGATSQVIGVDRDGHALITAVPADNQFGGPELWSTTSASSAVKLVIGFEINGAPRSDKYGLWIASAGRTQGTFLLTSTSDSAGGPYPIFDRVSTVAGTIAGPCLG